MKKFFYSLIIVIVVSQFQIKIVRAEPLLVDARLAKIIAIHVESIFENGYADELSNKDFSHGHFYFPPGPKGDCDFPNGLSHDKWVKELIARQPRFVYHTHELDGVSLPLDGGPHRSIIGFTDGRIYPLSSDTKFYLFHGMVHGYEEHIFYSKTYPGMCDPGSYFVKAGRNYDTIQFYLTPDQEGRYKANNQRYNIEYYLKE